MELKDIAAIAGKSGLYRILKPTKSGVIVEAMAGKPVKMVVSTQQRVSILQEISVYTTGEEESIPLADIFYACKEKYGEKIDIDTKDNEALFDFLGGVLNDYDKDRVYASDIKKMVNWFNLLAEKAPEVLVPKVEEESDETKDADKKEETE